MNTQPQRQTPILKLHRTQESKKVSVDDGYTQIPNELILKVAQFDFTEHESKVFWAVVSKTLSWHKEADWICNEQLLELTELKFIPKVSEAKNRLIQRGVLLQQGRKLSINLVISEWKNKEYLKQVKLTENRELHLPKSGKSISRNQVSTKETITKEKINNTPLPPKGKSAIADDEAVEVVAENSSEPTACRKTKLPPVDYAGIAQAYNEAVIAADKPSPKVADPEYLSDKRKRAIHKLAKQFQKRFGQYTPAAFRDYFDDFMRSAPPFYFGQNDTRWRADFEYLLRESTLDKTVEGGL